MVSEMLEISSIDSGFIQMDFEEIDLSGFCLGILHQYQPILENYQAEIQIEDGIFVSGDRKYLEQAVKNILNNAVQHTEEGRQFRIWLKCISQKAVIEVYNRGKAIPEEDLAHIWDAFYRTDKARTRNGDKNIGLGLYIVKTVMEKHKGDYYIRNQDEGVVAGITLDILYEPEKSAGSSADFHIFSSFVISMTKI